MLKPRPFTGGYMPHVADTRAAVDLKSVDGAALEAKNRIKKRNQAYRENTPNTVRYDFEADNRDYRACEKLHKRLQRGGATFTPGDTMG
jgi:hypothetical protein